MIREWFIVAVSSWESVTVLLIIAYVTARSLFVRITGNPNRLERDAYILFVLSSLGAGIAITQIKSSLGRDPLNELRNNLLSNADAQYVRRKLDELVDGFRQFQANHLELTGTGFVGRENAQLLGLSTLEVMILDLQPHLLNDEAFKTLKRAILGHAARLPITRVFVVGEGEHEAPCTFAIQAADNNATHSRLTEKFISRADFEAISAEFGDTTTRHVTDNLLFLYDNQILSVASPSNGAELGHLQIWWMLSGTGNGTGPKPRVLLDLIRRTAGDPRSERCGT